MGIQSIYYGIIDNIDQCGFTNENIHGLWYFTSIKIHFTIPSTPNIKAKAYPLYKEVPYAIENATTL